MRTLVLVATIALVFACSTEDAFEASTGETPAEYLDRECHELMLDCEYVYAFEAPSPKPPTENKLGRMELCVREADLPLAESLYGTSERSPDPRFDLAYSLGVGPRCIWHCDGGPGCNSYDGCFNCPKEMP